MGVLGNLDHERFCQAVHTRTWAGEKRSAALPAAYRETMYRGDREKAADAAIAPNARRLSQRKEVKARLAELAAKAGEIAALDAGWAMGKLKRMVEANIDDYLAPVDKRGTRVFDLSEVSREQLSLISELTVEDETELSKDEPPTQVRKIKIKLHDRISAISLMAKIAGWEAPKKQEHTGKDGGPIETMAVTDEQRAKALAAFIAQTSKETG